MGQGRGGWGERELQCKPSIEVASVYCEEGILSVSECTQEKERSNARVWKRVCDSVRERVTKEPYKRDYILQKRPIIIGARPAIETVDRKR